MTFHRENHTFYAMPGKCELKGAIILLNETIYITSMDLIEKVTLEVSRSFLSKHVCISTVMFE